MKSRRMDKNNWQSREIDALMPGKDSGDDCGFLVKKRPKRFQISVKNVFFHDFGTEWINIYLYICNLLIMNIKLFYVINS